MHPISGADLPGVVTSDELLDCDKLPQSLVIIGGGVIGMEFASVFSALGCRVTVVEALERILANMDKEISQNLKMIMKKRGVDIHAAAMVQEIAADPEGGLICSYTEKDKPAQAQGDLVLIATGRRACTEGLFAADASEAVKSMAMDRGRIQVNGCFETSVPGIYAIGDVTGGIQLAHAAAAQGRNAVAAMAGKEPSIGGGIRHMLETSQFSYAYARKGHPERVRILAGRNRHFLRSSIMNIPPRPSKGVPGCKRRKLFIDKSDMNREPLSGKK